MIKLLPELDTIESKRLIDHHRRRSMIIEIRDNKKISYTGRLGVL